MPGLDAGAGALDSAAGHLFRTDSASLAISS